MNSVNPSVAPTVKKTSFVSFSGIDGSGKSTQINALRTMVEQRGGTVTVIRFWDDIARLTGLRETTGHKVFKGDKGIGSPEAPINRRDKNVRSFPMTMVRLFMYALDAFSTRSAVKKALKSGVDLAIFDRYIYDEFANLTLANSFIRIYVKLLMSVVPRPDISYVLDADPIKARARKPEYPLDFLYFNRQAYLTLSDMLGGITIIPVLPIEDVKRAVVGHALNKLNLAQLAEYTPISAGPDHAGIGAVTAGV